MPGMRYQPQGLRRINRRNPLTRGLVFLMPMFGGSDVVDEVTGFRGAPVGQLETGTCTLGKFASFTASQHLNMPAIAELGETTPASIGWVQQPRPTGTYHSVLQIKVGAANPFLIYQSPSAPAHYFATGLRGGGQVANFRNNVGAMQAGKTDVCLLTSANGFGRNGGLSLFKSGEKFDPDSTTSLTSSGETGINIGHLGNGGDRWRGLLGCIAIWNRVLSDDEARSFSVNPWQLFAEPEEEWDQVSAASYALSVGSAALALVSGQVGMRVSRRLRAAPAALAVTAGPVAMRAARRLRVDPAALAVLAGPTRMLVARRFGVQPAALAVAGQGVMLRTGRRMQVAPMSLAIAGGPVAMQYSPALVPGEYTLPVSAAAMTLGGRNVGMRVSRRLSVAPAGMVLAVGGARLLAGRRLVVSPAALAQSASQVAIRVARRMRVQPAQLVLAGGNVQLRYSSQIEYARAPAGAGFAPQRTAVSARPAQTGGHRPPAIQETTR